MSLNKDRIAVDNETVILKDSIKILNESLNYYALQKEIENTAKKIYDERNKYEQTRNYTNLVITIIMAVISIFSILYASKFAVLSKLQYKEQIEKFKRDVNKKAKNEIDNFITALNDKASSQVFEFEHEFLKKIVELRAAFYYDFGMKFLIAENVEPALIFFKALYKSNNYRFDDVCFHLAECYEKLEENDKACKYLNEAKLNTKDKNKLYAIDKKILAFGCDKFEDIENDDNPNN